MRWVRTELATYFQAFGKLVTHRAVLIDLPSLRKVGVSSKLGIRCSAQEDSFRQQLRRLEDLVSILVGEQLS